jgi:membrane protein
VTRRGAVGRTLGHVHAFVDLLRAAWVEYEHDRARYLAVAMVYYALMSLVPLLLLLLAALGLLLRFSAAAAEAQGQMLDVVTAHFGPELSVTITGLLDTLQRESIVTTVVSLTGLLLTASVLFKHLRLTFRAIWKYDPPLVSGPVRVVVWATILDRVVAFVMVLGGGALLLAALGVIAATQWLDRVLARVPLLGPNSGWLLATASSLGLAAVTFAGLFRFLPPVPMRWRHVRLAALLCGAAWVVASELLALFTGFLGGSRSTSGALGVLAVMLWMNTGSQVLFFGAELCKVVATQEGGPPQNRVLETRRRP